MVDATSAPSTPPRGFWQRRLVDPLVAQLTQGVTPAKLSATLAVGTACSLFPFLGFTSLLNLVVGIRLRMNQPILQTLNQLLGPPHLVMILVYVRLGEWLWQASGENFTIGDMLRTFRDETFTVFLARFGWAGIHALTAWTVTTPLLIAGIYYGLRPIMQRFARRRRPSTP